MKKSVILAILILLVGCGTTSTNKEPVTNWRTGSQGLFMTFVPNQPPVIMYDREPFAVTINVQNLGTSPLGGGSDRIYLSGFDHSIITGIEFTGQAIPQLPGRDQFMTTPTFDTVTFRGTIRSLTEKNVDRYTPTLLATACYNYETHASGQVCVDPIPFTPTDVQKICVPSPVGTGSQGAPVAVTSIGVEPLPGKSRFIINIANVGGGTVFKYGQQYLNKCSPYNPGLAFDEVDHVEIADVTISGVSIRSSCRPIGPDSHVRLTGGVGQIYCELTNVQGQSAYLTPLNVHLRYGYRWSLARPIQIRPIS